jgi:hypothetical protein
VIQDTDLGGGPVGVDAPKVKAHKSKVLLPLPLILMIPMKMYLMKRPKMLMFLVLLSPQLM